jgi:hypothetical protein
MHVLTRFSLCVATIEEEAVNDAQATVQFLAQQVEAFGGSPEANRLIYLIVEALQRYHPRAAFVAWTAITPPGMERLEAVYKAQIQQLTQGPSNTMEQPDDTTEQPDDTTEQPDDKYTVANAILNWALNEYNDHDEFQHGQYHPALKMFIILHTTAVVCRDVPAIKVAKIEAAKWLAILDLEQLTLCEFIMIDLYRMVNNGTWHCSSFAAPLFFVLLEIKSLWGTPTDDNQIRWEPWMGQPDINPVAWKHWMGLLDINPSMHWMGLLKIDPWVYPEGTDAAQRKAVLDLFNLFLKMSVSYIRKMEHTELGKNNAIHMIQWMQYMWDRVREMFVTHLETQGAVQNYLTVVKRHLGVGL